MELILPSLGLGIWSAFFLLAILLPVFTIYKLASNKIINQDRKLIWLLIILVFPIIGSFAFFMFWNNKNFNSN